MRKHTSCIRLALKIAAKSHRMFEISCEQHDFPAHDGNDPPRRRGLRQRTPASSVHLDKGLETSASTSALVPSLAVLIAALPVPARADFLASLSSCHKLGFLQVGLRDQCSVKIRSENEVSGVFAPSCHVALQDVHHTFSDSEFTFPASVFAPSSVRMMTKGVAPFPAAHVAEFQL